MSETDVPAAAPGAPPATAPAVCLNCGAPMDGPYCHACGQPAKGMIRPLANVMADVADTIFNVDSRIFRSIPALYFRPGYLTVEYFEGHRTRYVTPFRLFFFLCVLSIFAIQPSIDLGDMRFNLGRDIGNIGQAQSAAEVQRMTRQALEGIDAAKNAPDMPETARTKLESSADAVRKSSQERLAWLQARDEAVAKGAKPPPDPNEDEGPSFDGVPWDPAAHPLRVGWLPTFANDRLNEALVHARDNLVEARHDPRRLVAGVFSVLPQTLFVLMPLFAVLLKVVYLFKRRLYMEHLMVALHSHAFIFLSLLVIALSSLLRGWAGSGAPALRPLLSLLIAAAWTWLPVYLFLMQKKVYRQGWFMTTVKYGVIGLAYIFLITFGLIGALAASLMLT